MVTLLCGRIGSGKTTLAKQIQIRTGAVLLSADDLLLTVFTGCLGDKHDETNARCLQYLFQMAGQLDALGISSIIDAGFWTRESRQNAREYFTSRNIENKLYYLYLEDDLRKARVAARNELLRTSTRREFILCEQTLARLDAKFEEPSAEEYDERVDMK